MKLLDDATFRTIEKAMDLRFKRHAVLSGNVANYATPNYRAREVDFGGELERAMGKGAEVKKTNSMHMDLASKTADHIVYDNSGAVGANGNNVDLDLAMGKISENSRAYQSAATLLSMKLRILRLVAQGRGGM